MLILIITNSTNRYLLFSHPLQSKMIITKSLLSKNRIGRIFRINHPKPSNFTQPNRLKLYCRILSIFWFSRLGKYWKAVCYRQKWYFCFFSDFSCKTKQLLYFLL